VPIRFYTTDIDCFCVHVLLRAAGPRATGHAKSDTDVTKGLLDSELSPNVSPHVSTVERAISPAYRDAKSPEISELKPGTSDSTNSSATTTSPISPPTQPFEMIRCVSHHGLFDDIDLINGIP
jgi:hypothetical protein